MASSAAATRRGAATSIARSRRRRNASGCYAPTRTNSETLEAARGALEGRQVDVLFIDGDHAYDGVKRDYEMYGSLVRDGGVIAFHDIVPPNPKGPRPRDDFDLQGGEVSGVLGRAARATMLPNSSRTGTPAASGSGRSRVRR